MIDMEYHSRQYEQVYETTKALLDLVSEVTGNRSDLRILDAACGGGANCFHMLNRFAGSHVTGVDLDQDLLAFARTKLPEPMRGRCDYVAHDLLDLPRRFPEPVADVTTLMQTLLLFGADDYANLIRSLVKVTRGWIVLSSLFSDRRMDVEMNIRDYVRFGEDSREQVRYTILDMERFRRVCAGLGVREVIFKDFEIGIDLAGPAQGLGTRTIRTEDGRRLQFSGAVNMPWKLAALRIQS
jgi:SAM-dependent methyltransferase